MVECLHYRCCAGQVSYVDREQGPNSIEGNVIIISTIIMIVIDINILY